MLNRIQAYIYFCTGTPVVVVVKVTLAYVDFDGVTAQTALSTLSEFFYTRYVSLFKVSMNHELFGSCI